VPLLLSSTIQGDDEDYDFDYESGDEDDEDNQKITEADPENNYYLAKGSSVSSIDQDSE
jgi:hypothetical protein